MNYNIDIPDYVKDIFSRFDLNNVESYIVGGCVRDSILKRKINDYDFCCQCLPEETIKIFSDYKTILTGKEYGTITVVSKGHLVEITTFRIDKGYSDSRHPDKTVYTSDIKKDLSRRDFTINAMCWSKKSGLIDLFNGLDDIKKREINCVGDPDKRFKEDGLRILRALRFASQLDFSISKSTSESINKNSKILDKVAYERIKIELDKFLFGNLKPLKDYYGIFSKYFGSCYLNSVEKVKSTYNLAIKYAFLYEDLDIDDVIYYCDKLKFSNQMKKEILFLKSMQNINIKNSYDIKSILSKNGEELTFLLLEKYDIDHSTNFLMF